ncbi:two-component system response regulator YesN [Bacillus oleivorans]|uniref:Two-component system response regulator YesN n=1 Tax=Bacillus oleivorans TaxID=1448271 RepID=A0A285D6Y3_9BACI|nr:response regulator [Bacillus oleivorans]SNX75570.1 two-component system response regulator YesN [Bacillus oleivorans]
MIKLLIVDDEQIEREGMQAILQNAFPTLVIEQAKNGKTAIEKTVSFQPDIILMDIKMPGMSGLEAVEHISKDYPHIKFIMVTAYDTFKFVQQAIKLGAKDYLLKPSKASEIAETIGKVLKQIEVEKQHLATSILQKEALQKTLALVETDIVTQLLFDHVHEVHLDMLVEMLDIQTMDEMFVMVVIVPTKSENLYAAIKEKVRQSGLVGAIYGSQLPIIVFRNPDQSFRSQAVNLARQILSIAKFEQESGLFIGIGNVYRSLDEVRQSYQESLMATMDTTLPVKYKFYSDVPNLNKMYNGQLHKQREQEISDSVRLGDWEQVLNKLMDIIHYYEIEGYSLLQSQQKILEVLWIVSRTLNELGVETVTPLYSFQIQDYRQLRSETGMLLDRMKDKYIEHFEHMESDTILNLKQYIIEHSHEDISLEQLAKKVNLSPIYISKIFKEKLGINYIDFLTECRIDQAKKLLADPEKSIKEITFEVGYHEPNYFSKVFKKVCNLTPKEYRNTLFRKKSKVMETELKR